MYGVTAGRYLQDRSKRARPFSWYKARFSKEDKEEPDSLLDLPLFPKEQSHSV